MLLCDFEVTDLRIRITNWNQGAGMTATDHDDHDYDNNHHHDCCRHFHYDQDDVGTKTFLFLPVILKCSWLGCNQERIAHHCLGLPSTMSSASSLLSFERHPWGPTFWSGLRPCPMFLSPLKGGWRCCRRMPVKGVSRCKNFQMHAHSCREDAEL